MEKKNLTKRFGKLSAKEIANPTGYAFIDNGDELLVGGFRLVESPEKEVSSMLVMDFGFIISDTEDAEKALVKPMRGIATLVQDADEKEFSGIIISDITLLAFMCMLEKNKIEDFVKGSLEVLEDIRNEKEQTISFDICMN